MDERDASVEPVPGDTGTKGASLSTSKQSIIEVIEI
jgi:hypothetical protein